jgi:hypothetical protein
MMAASFRARLTMGMLLEDRLIAPRALSRSKNAIDRLLVSRASQPLIQCRFFLLGSQDRDLNPQLSGFHGELLTKSSRWCLDQTIISVDADAKPIFTSPEGIIMRESIHVK